MDCRYICTAEDAKAQEMTSHINHNHQIIYCPTCKTSISVDKLRDYEDDNLEAKKQVIEEEVHQWG
jgi:hypothetical protein